jgi:hypothetical protein
VVDCGGLENRCAARHPGFESLSLREENVSSVKSRLYGTFFYWSAQVFPFIFSLF